MLCVKLKENLKRKKERMINLKMIVNNKIIQFH
jgi:hypothetical protein